MTYPKKMKLEVQIEADMPLDIIDMPLDIIEDKHRLRGWSSTLYF